MSVKAVVFDYGQVISLAQDHSKMEEIARRVERDCEEFKIALWALRGEYDRGTISERDYFKQVLSRLNVSLDDDSIDELVMLDSMSWKNVNPKTVSLMEELKAAGYLVGILSNMPKNFLTWAQKNLPVFSVPHASVFSCDVHLIKPEKAIYEKMLNDLNVRADETVFFDDKIENIKGASALGIIAVLWEDPECAKQKLLSLGVDL